MSGLIYNQRMTSDLTPDAPDSRPQQVVQQKVQNIQDTVQKQKEQQELLEQKQKIWEESQATKQQEYQDNLYKNQAIQSISNFATLFPDDINRFRTERDKVLKDIFNQIPDEATRARIMAEVQIKGSGYEARVIKKTADKQDEQYKASLKTSVLSGVDAGVAGLPTIFDSADANLSPFQIKENQTKFLNNLIELKKSYDRRNDVDANGNNIFTIDEKRTIAEAYEQAGKKAILAYTSENIQDNRQGVINTYEYLKNNRNEVIKQYNMDGKIYDKTLSDMKKIIDGESTAERMKTEEMFGYTIDDLGITTVDGKITLSTGMKKEDIFNTIRGLEQAYEQFLVGDVFYNRNIRKLKSAYWDMDKPLFGKKGWFRQEKAGQRLYNLVEGLTQDMGDGVDEKAGKLDIYMDLVGTLESMGVNMDSTNTKEVEQVFNAKAEEYFGIIYGEAIRRLGYNPSKLTDEQKDMVIRNANYMKNTTKIREQIGLKQNVSATKVR